MVGREKDADTDILESGNIREIKEIPSQKKEVTIQSSINLNFRGHGPLLKQVAKTDETKRF